MDTGRWAWPAHSDSAVTPGQVPRSAAPSPCRRPGLQTLSSPWLGGGERASQPGRMAQLQGDRAWFQVSNQKQFHSWGSGRAGSGSGPLDTLAREGP